MTDPDVDPVVPALNRVRSRDAEAAFRGFLYQIDLTILRWLELDEVEFLQVEYGEDVDIIRRVLDNATDVAEFERTCEQVKLRKDTLSLNTNEAVVALANACEHLEQNQDARLRFRYSTNAFPARERHVGLVDGTPGVMVWNQVRSGERQDLASDVAVREIRSLLEARTCPADLAEDTWNAFQRRIASPTETLELIRLFEWSFGLPDHRASRDLVTTKLRDLGHAESDEDATVLHDLLIARVAWTMGQPLPRLLTRPALADLLAGQAGTAEETGLAEALQARIDHFERVVRHQLERLETRQAAVEGVLAGAGVEIGDVSIVLRPIDTAVPPQVGSLARREGTASALSEDLQQAVWVALTGEPGTGKTELANIVARRPWRVVSWIRVREDSSPAEASTILARAAAQYPEADDALPMERLARAHSDGGLIVLDDLPRFAADDPLGEFLTSLTTACVRHTSHVLSTSRYALGTRVLEREADRVRATPVPMFDVAEIREALLAHGAPPDVLSEQVLAIVESTTGGHATLIAAAARWMRSQEWRLTVESLEDLLRGRPFDELTEETTRIVLERVGSEAARELLYRLNTSKSPFKRDTVPLLGEVAPPVRHPLDRLSELLDLCVRQTSSTSLAVSPLFQLLGSGNLSADTQRGCHRVFGIQVLRQATIDPIDAWRALGHFSKAEEWAGVGTVLLGSLSSLVEAGNIEDDWMFGTAWHDQPLPEPIPAEMRLTIRALQIVVCHRLGKDYAPHLAELDALRRTPEASGAYGQMLVAGLVCHIVAESDVTQALEMFASAYELANAAPPPEGVDLEYAPLEPALWLIGMKLRDIAGLRSWVETLARLGPDVGARLTEHEGAIRLAPAMFDRLWINDEERTRAEALEFLQFAHTEFERLRNGLLLGCVTRVQVILIAEKNGDLEGALALAESTLAQEFLDRRGRFLVGYIAGAQYSYRREHAEARPWLTAAVEVADEVPVEQHIYALLYLAAGETDISERVSLCERAVAIGAQDETADFQMAKCWGELGLALWERDGTAAAAHPMLQAVLALIAARSDSDTWRALLVSIGHTTGYLYSLAATGTPPEQTAEGEEYGRPPPGLIAVTDVRLAQYFHDESDAALRVHIGGLLTHAGEWSDWRTWITQAYVEARNQQVHAAISLLGAEEATRLIGENEFEHALEAAVQSCQSVAVAAQERGVIMPGDPAERAPLFWLMQTMIRLATIRMQDPDSFAVALDSAVRACSERALVAARAGYWNELATGIRKAWRTDAGFRALVQEGNANKENKDTHLLHGACYLAASMSDDCLPSQAFVAQATVVKGLDEISSFRSSSTAYLLVPFLTSYWHRALQEQRFRFRAPDLALEQLENALRGPTYERPKEVFRALQFSVSEQVPEFVTEWLGQAGPTTPTTEA